MSLSEHTKLAISVASGSIAAAVVYLTYFKKRSYQLEPTEIEQEPWPTQGSNDEKEALIDAILEEPCMLEAMIDPTREAKFNSGEAPLIQDYRFLLLA